MSRTNKDRFLYACHQEKKRRIREKDWSYSSELILIHRRKLPIRTGANGHRYGNLRKYYAEMKVLGRRRQRAMSREEFRKELKDFD